MTLLQTSPIVLCAGPELSVYLFNVETEKLTKLDIYEDIRSVIFLDNKTLLFNTKGDKNRYKKKIINIYTGAEIVLEDIAEISKVKYLPKSSSPSPYIDIDTNYYDDFRGNVKYLVTHTKNEGMINIYQVNRDAKISLKKIDIGTRKYDNIFTIGDKYIIATDKPRGKRYFVINVETRDIDTFPCEKDDIIRPYLLNQIMIINKNTIRIWNIEKRVFIKSYDTKLDEITGSGKDVLIIKNDRHNDEFYLLNTTNYQGVRYYDSYMDMTYVITHRDSIITEEYDKNNKYLQDIAISYLGNDSLGISYVDEKGILYYYIYQLDTQNYVQLRHAIFFTNVLLISKNICITRNALLYVNTGEYVYKLDDKRVDHNNIKYPGFNVISVMPFRTDEQITKIYNLSLKVLNRVSMVSMNIKKVIANFI